MTPFFERLKSAWRCWRSRSVLVCVVTVTYGNAIGKLTFLTFDGPAKRSDFWRVLSAMTYAAGLIDEDQDVLWFTCRKLWPWECWKYLDQMEEYPVCHVQHRCRCGGLDEPHCIGDPGCHRAMLSSVDTPIPSAPGMKGEWVAAGGYYTGRQLFNRGWHRHPCGCWSGCAKPDTEDREY